MSQDTRTGIFGGMFDPIHQGHVDVAVAARRTLQLDRVMIVPARVAPHRPIQPVASTYHRFAMVAVAVLRHDGLVASDLELRAPGPSYTTATLDRLVRAGHDPSQLFFITGADAFAEIATWRDYPAILDHCHFVVISRPDNPVGRMRVRLSELAGRMVDVPSGPGGGVRVPETPSILLIDTVTAAVSSTEIRNRAASRKPLTGLVPPEVETYIHRHGLYSAAGAADDLHDQT